MDVVPYIYIYIYYCPASLFRFIWQAILCAYLTLTKQNITSEIKLNEKYN